jgi:hypothetical protein
MGLIALVLNLARKLQGFAQVDDVKTDIGSQTTITAEHYSAPGDDSNPLPQDYCALVDLPRVNGYCSVGYLDPKNANISAPGEKRIYARDSSGNVVSDIHLKNDGSVVIDNGTVSMSMDATGLFRVDNGAGFFELTAAGVFNASSITAPSIIVNGKELDGHLHSGVQTGGSNTGPIV